MGRPLSVLTLSAAEEDSLRSLARRRTTAQALALRARIVLACAAGDPNQLVANGAELWRRLKVRGFRGSLRVISEWATRRRRAEKADAQNLRRIPSARTIARLMTIGRDLLTKAETVTVAAIEAGLPTLVEAREIIAEFHLMIRRKVEAGFTPWIERARASLIGSFASGFARDEAAVRAAITLSWSNGQTEGQITRLKLVRRQMYGRGKIDLLQARLIGAE
jgi:transposase